MSDFGFQSFGGNPSYECVGVSQTSDPGSGRLVSIRRCWWIRRTRTTTRRRRCGIIRQPGGAYHFTYNMWASLQGPFTGVKVQALDRARDAQRRSKTANVITFKIPLAGVGASYSLVPAGFRTGDPPPDGRDEMLLAVDASPASENTPLTQVHGWLFHVDFANPANSTVGLGADHTPNAEITVAPFVEAWTNAAGFTIVPQQGTSAKLDTLGDKLMTPVVYQNRNGTESLWADQTNNPELSRMGRLLLRWYQFDVTGGTFPATRCATTGLEQRRRRAVALHAKLSR